jgi:phosphonate transport system permease protein
VQMSLIGTTVGVLIAFPLAALAARNVGPRLLQGAVRQLLNIIRTIPSLIWALIFVAAVGFGPLAGVLALTFYSLGYLTKFFYESFEAADTGPQGALEELGASGLQRFTHAVWPAALPAAASSCLFVLEYNVRAASVLGIVDAGGIGWHIKHFLDYRNFPAAIACLALVLAVVIMLDAVSTRVRAWAVAR